MNEFKSEYLCEWPDDKEFEFYVQAWLVYHRTANIYDGHIERPTTREEHRRVGVAGRAGNRAQAEYMRSRGFEKREVNRTKWRQANEEALRIIEREPFDGPVTPRGSQGD